MKITLHPFHICPHRAKANRIAYPSFNLYVSHDACGWNMHIQPTSHRFLSYGWHRCRHRQYVGSDDEYGRKVEHQRRPEVAGLGSLQENVGCDFDSCCKNLNRFQRKRISRGTSREHKNKNPKRVRSLVKVHCIPQRELVHVCIWVVVPPFVGIKFNSGEVNDKSVW